MKNHTFGVGWPTFKHAIIQMREGTQWLDQVAENNSTLSYQVTVGCPLKTNLGENFSYMCPPQVVGNRSFGFIMKNPLC